MNELWAVRLKDAQGGVNSATSREQAYRLARLVLITDSACPVEIMHLTDDGWMVVDTLTPEPAPEPDDVECGYQDEEATS